MSELLKFVLPNGSLSAQCRKYLEIAGYPVPMAKPDRTGYCGVSNGVMFYELDRRLVPNFINSMKFDAGITGRDLVVNSGIISLCVIAELQFSRASEKPTRWVLARRKGQEFKGRIRVACELPQLAQRLLTMIQKARLPHGFDVWSISGSEEQVVSQGMADAVLVVTESGDSIVANDLEIVPGCEELFVSVPQILSLPDLPREKVRKIKELAIALRGVVGAQDFILLKADIPSKVDVVSLQLPADVAPSILPTSNPAWQAIEVCVPRSRYGELTFRLTEAGAQGIIMVPVAGHHA